MKRNQSTTAEPAGHVADRPGENAAVDFDLDALMARVRAAAAAGSAGAAVLAVDAQETSTGEPLDLLQIISAQVEWNRQTTRTLAAVAECLHHIQSELTVVHEALRIAAPLSELVQGTRHEPPPHSRRARLGRLRSATKRRSRRK